MNCTGEKKGLGFEYDLMPIALALVVTTKGAGLFRLTTRSTNINPPIAPPSRRCRAGGWRVGNRLANSRSSQRETGMLKLLISPGKLHRVRLHESPDLFCRLLQARREWSRELMNSGPKIELGRSYRFVGSHRLHCPRN